MRTHSVVRLSSLGLLAALGLVALLLVLAVAPAFAASRPVGNGMTWLTTDPGTTAALGDAGIMVKRVPPTRLKSVDEGASLKASFPVGGGRLDVVALKGTVRHGGGLRLVQPDTGAKIKLSKFWIKLDGAENATVTARVNGRPRARVTILDVDLSTATVDHTRKWVDIRGATVSLTETAADALNATFSTTPIFSEGLVLGTVDAHVHVARGRR
jgi:hypothetical protein